MKFIIGLGNPGIKYKKTRHNAGYLAINKLAQEKEYDFGRFKNLKRFRSDVSQGRYKDENVYLVKPYTYMNNSGQAVFSIYNFYENELAYEDLIVIHDDIDLNLGQVKIDKGVRSAGHKGVDSIMQSLKTKDFYRIRIGIKIKESENIPTENYVLMKFSKSELEILNKAIDTANKSLKILLGTGLNPAKEFIGQQKNL